MMALTEALGPVWPRASSNSDSTISHGYRDVHISDSASVHMGDSIVSLTEFEAIENLRRQEQIHEMQRSRDIQTLLRGLDYDGRNRRITEIESTMLTNMASLDWVWTTSFGSWITGDNQLFYVSGKPASGKSTLMKYLSSSIQAGRDIGNSMDKWSTLEFYFDFSAGSHITNSTKGMLRSLLFQLVNKNKPAAAYVCSLHGHALNGSWLESEVDLLNTICDILRSMPGKFCAFIDGLDEYNSGRAWDLIGTLRTVMKRTGLKMCLASRPLGVISQLLASAPTLSMQDHNATTIRDYIDLVRNELTPDQAIRAESLWPTIEKESNGVILWARLVIDELIIPLMSGATTKELQDTLQRFSSGMDGVYTRVLAGLTGQQKLHAAIIFYMIEHGRSLFGKSHDFPTHEFFVSWTIMVETLDQEVPFDITNNIEWFAIRIHAMLGGLVEFSDISSTVRLVHTTLESYLSRTGIFHSIVSNHIEPIYGHGIAAQTFIFIITQANEEVLVDFQALDALEVIEDNDQDSCSHSLLKHLQPRFPEGHIAHRLQYLLSAIERFAYALPDSRDFAQVTWAVIRSPIFRLHPFLCRDVGCVCSETSEPNLLNDKPFWRDRWALRYLASHGLYHAFEHGIRELKQNWVSWAIEDLLGLTVEIVRKAQLGSELAGSAVEPSRKQHNPFRLNGHVLVEVLLEGVRIQAHHIAIHQIIEFPNEPAFLSRARASLSPIYLKPIANCPWFKRESANLLCSWAWSSDDCYDKDTQISRLRHLISLGLSVNMKAYPGGTVMHALFDYQDSYLASDHVHTHHFLWPFNRTKFDLLLDAGYDFAPRGKDNTMLTQARSFGMNLHKRAALQKPRAHVIKQLHEYDEFVHVILEPICVSIAPVEWSLETPASLSQQSTEYSGFVLDGAEF